MEFAIGFLCGLFLGFVSGAGLAGVVYIIARRPPKLFLEPRGVNVGASVPPELGEEPVFAPRDFLREGMDELRKHHPELAARAWGD